jgi:proteasome accessory factor A
MDARSHEDYLVKNPQKAQRSLIPFLITRQIFAGAGKVGGERPEFNGGPYQISQRADFVETVFGLETMFARPIVNTRQEHHADEKRFRRVHLIMGDANMCEFAAVLKIGTTQMLLQLMEDDFVDEDLSLEDPVKAFGQISSDIFRRIALADGRKLRAIDIQAKFLEKALEYHRVKGFSGVPAAAWILESWEYVLRGLEVLRLSSDLRIEDDPLELTRRLDWLLKLWLLNRFREGKGHRWDLPNLRVLDLQYHNISPDHGIFSRLQREGLVERLLSEEDISKFVKEAPRDTRAHFRGKCLERFPREVYLVNWEVVGFNHGKVNRLVPLLNPLDGTSRQMNKFFENCADSKELINAIQASACT